MLESRACISAGEQKRTDVWTTLSRFGTLYGPHLWLIEIPIMYISCILHGVSVTRPRKKEERMAFHRHIENCTLLQICQHLQV